MRLYPALPSFNPFNRIPRWAWAVAAAVLLAAAWFGHGRWEHGRALRASVYGNSLVRTPIPGDDGIDAIVRVYGYGGWLLMEETPVRDSGPGPRSPTWHRWHRVDAELRWHGGIVAGPTAVVYGRSTSEPRTAGVAVLSLADGALLWRDDSATPGYFASVHASDQTVAASTETDGDPVLHAWNAHTGERLPAATPLPRFHRLAAVIGHLAVATGLAGSWVVDTRTGEVTTRFGPSSLEPTDWGLCGVQGRDPIVTCLSEASRSFEPLLVDGQPVRVPPNATHTMADRYVLSQTSRRPAQLTITPLGDPAHPVHVGWGGGFSPYRRGSRDRAGPYALHIAFRGLWPGGERERMTSVAHDAFDPLLEDHDHVWSVVDRRTGRVAWESPPVLDAGMDVYSGTTHSVAPLDPLSDDRLVVLDHATGRVQVLAPDPEPFPMAYVFPDDRRVTLIGRWMTGGIDRDWWVVDLATCQLVDSSRPDIATRCLERSELPVGLSNLPIDGPDPDFVRPISVDAPSTWPVRESAQREHAGAMAYGVVDMKPPGVPEMGSVAGALAWLAVGQALSGEVSEASYAFSMGLEELGTPAPPTDHPTALETALYDKLATIAEGHGLWLDARRPADAGD